MSGNLPTRMAQRQAAELRDRLRDAVGDIRRLYASRGFSTETVDRELEHALRDEAVNYSPERLP